MKKFNRLQDGSVGDGDVYWQCTKQPNNILFREGNDFRHVLKPNTIHLK